MTLTKEQIVAAVQARRTEVVTISVPEWGGTVCIRRMTPAEVEESGLAEGKRDAAMFARVMAVSICGEDGSLLFTEEGAASLVDVDIAVAARVFAECMRANGLMDEDLEKAIASFGNAQTGPTSSS